MSYERYSLRIMRDKPRVIRVLFRCFVSDRLQKSLKIRRAFSGHPQVIILPVSELRFFAEVLFSDIKTADIADFAVNDGHFPVIPFLRPEK